MAVRIAAVIPTYKRCPYLQGALESLCGQSLAEDEFEIIVVDNNTEPTVQDIAELVQKEQGRAIIYVHEPNLGLHNGRHAGARAATAPIIALTDDDAICDPLWLEKLLEVYQEQGAVCVGGKIVPQWETPPPAWLEKIPSSYLSLLDHGEGVREIAWNEGIYGCNFSINIEVLFSVNGFNPECMGDRWMGDGESGLLKRLAEAGHSIHYSSEAWVKHIVRPERLTLEGMKHRFANHGANNSFVSFRMHNSAAWKLAARSLVFGALAMGQALKGWGMKLVGNSDYRLPLLQQAYYRGRCFFDWELIFSAELRSFTQKENYLNEA